MIVKNKIIRKLCVTIGVVLAISTFCIWENNAITTTKIDYINDKIPEEFDGYRIVHISDLHNKPFGRNQERLLKKISAVSPDIIVVTGDLIDRRKYDLETAMVFINGAVKIAPVYYVSGNHEAWSGHYENISESLINSGVQVLDDAKTVLSKGQGEIEILGLSDPDFLTYSYLDGTNTSKLRAHLERLSDDSVFQILLCHRPELFDIYVNQNIDLIFSGHAHGGQVRIPFVGGLVAPDQGLFPKYTSGAYTQNQSTMIVSRGLGNSVIPIRIFNRPEIVVVTLRSE
ncbi:MAG TPA: metallophosphoesterase [Thermoanaerobacterales bacterium]|nr:metallophosphoesterase [Thermoanaerobacterales bacterium]